MVEEIISHGRKFNLGLEAGSKPELHAVLAVQCQSDSLIICNGYKDQAYIELALLAQKMGKRIFIVVEKLNELETIATVAKKLNVKPNLGIRIKLASCVAPANGKRVAAMLLSLVLPALNCCRHSTSWRRRDGTTA